MSTDNTELKGVVLQINGAEGPAQLSDLEERELYVDLRTGKLYVGCTVSGNEVSVKHSSEADLAMGVGIKDRTILYVEQNKSSDMKKQQITLGGIVTGKMDADNRFVLKGLSKARPLVLTTVELTAVNKVIGNGDSKLSDFGSVTSKAVTVEDVLTTSKIVGDDNTIVSTLPSNPIDGQIVFLLNGEVYS